MIETSFWLIRRCKCNSLKCLLEIAQEIFTAAAVVYVLEGKTTKKQNNIRQLLPLACIFCHNSNIQYNTNCLYTKDRNNAVPEITLLLRQHYSRENITPETTLFPRQHTLLVRQPYPRDSSIPETTWPLRKHFSRDNISLETTLPSRQHFPRGNTSLEVTLPSRQHCSETTLHVRHKMPFWYFFRTVPWMFFILVKVSSQTTELPFTS